MAAGSAIGTTCDTFKCNNFSVLVLYHIAYRYFSNAPHTTLYRVPTYTLVTRYNDITGNSHYFKTPGGGGQENNSRQFQEYFN